MSIETSIANLKNIEILSTAVSNVIKSPNYLPKLISFSGYSGYGKSFAAALVANKFRCFYLEVGSSWNISYLLDMMLKEMGINSPRVNIPRKVELIIDNLVREKQTFYIR